VEGAGIDMQLGGDSLAGQAPRVLQVLLQEQVQGAGGDEGRRQTRKAFGPGRGGVGQDSFDPGLMPEQGRPAETVVVRGPDKLSRRGVRIGARAGAVVNHRVDQVLEGEPVLAPVPDQQGETCGKASAGALAHDPDPLRVDSQFGGVSQGPGQGGVAVLHGAGEAGLGRQAILHRDNDAPEVGGHGPVQGLVGVRPTRDIAAPVDVQDAGQGPRDTPGPVDEDLDLGIAGATGDEAADLIGPVRILGVGGEPGGPAPHAREHGLGQDHCGKGVEHGQELRVDQVAREGIGHGASA